MSREKLPMVARPEPADSSATRRGNPTPSHEMDKKPLSEIMKALGATEDMAPLRGIGRDGNCRRTDAAKRTTDEQQTLRELGRPNDERPQPARSKRYYDDYDAAKADARRAVGGGGCGADERHGVGTHARRPDFGTVLLNLGTNVAYSRRTVMSDSRPPDEKDQKEDKRNVRRLRQIADELRLLAQDNTAMCIGITGGVLLREACELGAFNGMKDRDCQLRMRFRCQIENAQGRPRSERDWRSGLFYEAVQVLAPEVPPKPHDAHYSDSCLLIADAVSAEADAAAPCKRCIRASESNGHRRGHERYEGGGMAIIGDTRAVTQTGG